MQLLDWSFLTFFIAGGVAFLWFVIIGAIFIFFYTATGEAVCF